MLAVLVIAEEAAARISTERRGVHRYDRRPAGLAYHDTGVTMTYLTPVSSHIRIRSPIHHSRERERFISI